MPLLFYNTFIYFSLMLLLLVLISSIECSVKIIDETTDELNKVGLSSAEAVRARGYYAREHYFKTKDGYILCITECLNPLFNQEHLHGQSKQPVLFVHGAFASGTLWLTNSAGIEPKDFTSHLDASINNDSEMDGSNEQINEKILWQLLDQEPSTKSLPFLAMNFGHPVWMLNRRGYHQSEHRAGHMNRTIDEVMRSIPKTLLEAHSKNRETSKGKVDNDKNKEEKSFDIFEKLFEVSMSLSNDSIKRAIEHDRETFIHNFDADYWSFSLDEQVAYDIPQAIDYVLRHSNHDQLSIVGHSIGGALTLLLMSEKPEYQDKSEFNRFDYSKQYHYDGFNSIIDTTNDF